MTMYTFTVKIENEIVQIQVRAHNDQGAIRQAWKAIANRNYRPEQGVYRIVAREAI
jgi:mannitol/fructose-specific phosphotransferase system IIA component